MDEITEAFHRFTIAAERTLCAITRLTMEKDMDETQRRVHGFAVGERVAVVDGPFKGCYGRLTYVGGGWCNNASEGADNCRQTCWIFCMSSLGGPPDTFPDDLDEQWFSAAQLTHVD